MHALRSFHSHANVEALDSVELRLQLGGDFYKVFRRLEGPMG